MVENCAKKFFVIIQSEQKKLGGEIKSGFPYFQVPLSANQTLRVGKNDDGYSKKTRRS